MANKTIPELPEIDLADLDPAHLLILETAIATYKLRLETVQDFLFDSQRRAITVTFDGVETAAKDVDVTAYVPDAQVVIWMLKKPSGEQMPAIKLSTPDADTVTIDPDGFALDAGDYILLGV